VDKLKGEEEMIKTYVDNNANVVIKLKLTDLINFCAEYCPEIKNSDRYAFVDKFLKELTDDSDGNCSYIEHAFVKTIENMMTKLEENYD